MKAEEKQLIYRLLKVSDAAAQGYVSPDFYGEEPAFCDDGEVRAEEVRAEDARLEKPEIEKPETAAEKEGPLRLGSTCESISEKIAACKRCKLCQERKNVVPGEGVLQPAVLVIGEGPGAEEDEQGRPFVGRAGQLLDKMLSSIGLDRNKNCFITNIVKCRPPMNRDPLPDEAAACRSFLDAQIHVLKPKLILAMGRVALHNLLDTSIGITRMHGQFVDFNGIPFMATFHPSALLRDESYKRPAWEDLKKFRERLLEIVPDYV